MILGGGDLGGGRYEAGYEGRASHDCPNSLANRERDGWAIMEQDVRVVTPPVMFSILLQCNMKDSPEV